MGEPKVWQFARFSLRSEGYGCVVCECGETVISWGEGEILSMDRIAVAIREHQRKEHRNG